MGWISVPEYDKIIACIYILWLPIGKERYFMAIYYVMIEAVPKPDNSESREFGGAYVGCWVNAATRKEALAIAKEYVDAEDWIYKKTEEVFKTDRNQYTDDPEALEYYDYALENGLSSIFNTWPLHEGELN